MSDNASQSSKLAVFYQQNPEFNIRDFDFYDPNQLLNLNLDGLIADDIIEELKALQRLLRICPDDKAVEVLKAAGYDSAFKIASVSQTQFISELATALGEDGENIARTIYTNAVNKKNQAMHVWAAAHNVTSPHFEALRVNNVHAGVADFFKGLPDYQDMFGSLNYCECSDCKSVFGPAAYFVDLMRITDKYVNYPNSDTIPAGMKLANRRPDLCNIKLTCDNTNQTMPYIKIVNERLEDTVGNVLGGQEHIYQTMAQKYYPLNLPLQLPLAKTRLYLGQLNTTLAEIYQSLNLDNKYWAAEYLHLSPEEWQLLTVSQVGDDKLKEYYGVTDLAELAMVDFFCQETGITLVELREILYQNLSADEILEGTAKAFFINQSEKDCLQIALDGETQTIKNLTNSALDKLHRFIRLANKLGWSYTDLDWVLHCVSNGVPTMDETALIGIAMLQVLMDQLNIPVDVACTLVFDLKTYGKSAPFTSAFNGSGLEPYRPDYRSINPSFTQPIWQWTISADDEANRKLTTRVASGLGLKGEDLKVLALTIFDGNNPVALSVANLSLLYRHTKLSILTNLSMQQYVQLLIVFGSGQGLNAQNVLALLTIANNLRSAGCNIFEVDYIVNGTVSQYIDVLYREQGVDSWLLTLPSLTKSSAAGAEELAQEQTAKIIDQLAIFFNSKSEQIEALLQFFDHPDLVSIFLNEANKEQAKAMIKNLSRYLVLANKLYLSADELLNIAAQPASYGINRTQNVLTLTAANVLAIYQFKTLEATYDDVAGNLQQYMTAADDVEAAVALNKILPMSVDDLKKLLLLFAGNNKIECLAKVGTVLDIIEKTGTNLAYVQTLSELASKTANANWSDYEKTAENLLATVKASYADDVWSSLYQNLDGVVQEWKRSALAAIALVEFAKNESTRWVKNLRNLYEYLLIDVEMGGSAQISYIKEGLNAVQLYLNRCREQLEPGIESLEIPTVWWEWIINYQLWAANRMIFLYPENYLDPTSRKSSTQLFKDLEDALKQGDINAQTVENAYRNYLDSFAELAKLVYVDAFYCKVNDSQRDNAPTLFAFARTQTQPYTYYYIVQEYDGTWSDWSKINITINSDTLSPIYAFNRLFVFWTEIKESENRLSDNSTNKVDKASIKYSFYNFSGDWVQPQTLVEDAVISVQGATKLPDYSGLYTPDLFDTNHQWWNKVYPLKLEKGKYWFLGSGANKFEKIVLFYGPMLNTDNYSSWNVSALTEPSTTDEFSYRLYRSAKSFKFLKDNGYSGCLPIFPGIVLNDDLERGFLVEPDEYIFLSKDSPLSILSFRPNVDLSSGTWSLIHSTNVIYDNDNQEQIFNASPLEEPKKLDGASFVSTWAGIEATASQAIYQQLVNDGYINNKGMPGKIDFGDLADEVRALLKDQTDNTKKFKYVMKVLCEAAGSPIISRGMRSKKYEIFTVKNHPAAMIFKGEKEAFLLADPGRSILPVSAGIYNGDTLFGKKSFISKNASIDAVGSEAVYNQLIEYGYLSSAGILSTSTMYDELVQSLKELFEGQPGESDKVAVVKNILMHRAIFQSNSFISTDARIEAKGSEQIYNQLIGWGYLDKDGHLDADVDFYSISGDIADLLAGQPDQDKKVRSVVDTLFRSSFPSSVGYYANMDDDDSIAEYKYEATRMTTAAVHNLSSALFTGGIDRLLSLHSQQIPVESELPFECFDFNDLRVTPPVVSDGTQVDFDGTYGLYYWELFFHGPLLIYKLLQTNQKFQDAENWLKYIFNPTVQATSLKEDSFVTSTMGIRESRSAYKILLDKGYITSDGTVSATFTKETDLTPYLKSILNPPQIQSVKNNLLNYKLSTPLARLWQFQPFRNHTIETLKDQLQNPKEIAAYNSSPFDPFAIARLRLGAYEKSVVMQYIDNLLDWGDFLFQQYTWESLTTATMLYNYAYDLLGDRPEDLGPCKDHAPVSYKDVYDKYQYEIPQFLLDMEHISGDNQVETSYTPVNELDTFFCVPENKDFMAYWDRVEDRLYKIRHSLNLQGKPQSLALFEPLLDPKELARIAALGGDVLSLLTQRSTGTPNYRFSYMLERARNMVNVLSQLGAEMLAALEKKDAEALAILRSTQEKVILNLTTLSKEKQIEEASDSIESLQESQKSAENRLSHYQGLYDQNLNGLEIAGLTLMSAAVIPQSIAIGIRGLAIAGYLAPNIFGLADGGMQFGEAINMGAAVADGAAGLLTHSANIINTSAQYVRRREEWKIQLESATYDVAQIKKQIASSQARLAYLQRELEIHQKSIEQAEQYDNFIKNKFTNEELYQWMIGRLSTLYFQTYRMALDMALSAQAAYQNELAVNDRFIEFNYWDSLRKGLLAGESLMLSLNQMEKSYIETNARSLEIEKTISLLHLNPEKFMEFKWGINGAEQGKLTFELTEAMFDFDFPGHYLRRIKSVSVTVPAIAGPYQNVNATLTQNSSAIVLRPEIKTVQHVLDPVRYPDYPVGSLRENWLPNQQIAISRGMDDTGLFQLNFADERYLPFEGTGAVSKWTFNMPPDTNRIDFSSISDVIITIKYTASDGGSNFSNQIRANLYSTTPPYPYQVGKCFDLKQAFSGEWNKFIHSQPIQGIERMRFQITDEILLPNLRDVKLKAVTVLINTPEGKPVSDKDKDTHFIYLKTSEENRLPITINNNYGVIALAMNVPVKETWTLEFDVLNAPTELVKDQALNPDVLLDTVVVIQYESNVFKPAK